MPIIKSKLDTDLYKLTMGQLVFHRHKGKLTTYHFMCRNTGVNLTPYIHEIYDEIMHFANLKITSEEISYLRGTNLFKEDYLNYLKMQDLSNIFIDVNNSDSNDGTIDICITGPWEDTILFEVPVLSIVNEIYFNHTQTTPDYNGALQLLKTDIELIKENLNENPVPINILEFGTRRRFSAAWQEKVLLELQNGIEESLIGTSNVYLAMKRGLKPMGTMAHEYICAYQSISKNLRDCQKDALEDWLLEYRGKLAVALTDTLGTKAFINDMDGFLLKNYDGFRHDSGSPEEWTSLMLNMFKSNNINTMTKTLMYSDGLTVIKAIELHNKYSHMTNVKFGIGTHLTNRFPNVTPLNIVMKLVYLNGKPVAKISDNPSKSICKSTEHLQKLKTTFGIDL